MDKNRLKALITKSLEKQKQKILESRIKYDENHSERMNPKLVKQLRERTHSLGNHPAFPESDDTNFEEKLMSKRFTDVLKQFKRHHGVEAVDINEIARTQKEALKKIVELESKHRDRLIEMAKQLVMEDFDFTEEDLIIEAELTTDLNIKPDDSKIKVNDSTDIEFDDHDELTQANKEVYKRRMVNALIQGSAKKTNHMFHLIDSELQDLEPILPNLYAKLMTGADYMYMIKDDSEQKVIGGLVSVDFPDSEGDIPKITAQAVCLPVLIHEIVKGVMEVISYHGLPENTKIAEFVIDKADFMDAENWDMRLGPPIWERFLESIPAEDYGLKHHVYVELVSLPVEDFNIVFREILMGSKKGKLMVSNMIHEIKDELRNDEFDNAVDMISDDEYLSPEDLDNLNSEDWFLS